MTTDQMSATFTQYRAYLFSIAYRMLGSVMDAEDLVQETWLRWQQSDVQQIQNPKSFLAAITTRLCIDYLRSARVKRESYIGPWLPEPLLTDKRGLDGESMMVLADNISFAFMQLLEKLSPTERAVYLLRHVFDFEYSEIAEIVNKKEPACRQIYRRARHHLAAEKPRFDNTIAEQQVVMGRFWQACLERDMETVRQLIAEDATFYSDGGGQVRAARRPVRTADHVIQFLMGLLRLAPEGMEVKSTIVNGQPGMMILVNGRLFNIFVIDVRHMKVQNIYSILNPDKLKHIQLE